MAVTINQEEVRVITQIEKDLPDQFKIILELIEKEVIKALERLSINSRERSLKYLRQHYISAAIESTSPSNRLSCNINQ
jgi:Mg/Co/Ni transporter MgtE